MPLRETSANAPLQLSMRSSPNQLYRVHSKSIFLTGLAGIGALLFGLHLGWASPARKSLQHQSGLSDKQIDIILGVLNIGAAIGSLLAAPIAEILGRKTTIIFAKLPFILGTMIMSFLTQSMFWLVLGRICKYCAHETSLHLYN